MLKKSKPYSDLVSKCKARADIADVISFGSAVKGKLAPNDIDVCIVFRGKVDRTFANEIGEKFSNFHISMLTIDNFFTRYHSLVRTLLYEGKSLFTGKSVASVYGLDAFALYSYSLTGLSAKAKVQFVQVLNGRNDRQGMIAKWNGKVLARGCFIIPVVFDAEALELFNKRSIKFIRKRIMLMK